MDETSKQKLVGYCNHCARLLKVEDIGVMIVGASGQWCRRSECREDAKRWQDEFLKQNPVDAEKFVPSEMQF